MPMHVGQSFAELLRRARRDAGLTQEELAARAGISTRAVSDLERAINRAPQLETLRLLADALDRPADERQRWTMARRRVASHAHDGGASQPSNGQLPTPLTSFVGRDRELAELVALLGQPDTRLVTITGTGGVGKTRLAIAVGTAVEGALDRFPDGVRFVPLAPLNNPDLVIRAIATALDVEGSSRTSQLTTLIAALRNRRLSLVLDNVEHVAASAPQLADLLRACPGLTILATSRVPLRVRGEREYKIRPFALPADIAALDLDHLRRLEAIDLFRQRAQDVATDFQITERNAQVVAGVCRRVDGLPLAIELVAARVRLLPPAALLERLDRRLPLLTGAPHDAPARQQTLRDTIAWSYDLLNPAHQRLFRALGVFQDGWTLDALEAVTGQTEAGSIVLDGLETLIAHSLVRMHEQVNGQPRYSMLETIAEFAREKLDASDEALEARRRHVRHYLRVARQAEPHLKGAEQARWMARLEQEFANLRGALQWLQERAEQGDAAAVVTSFQLADPIWWFWHIHGHMREGRQQFDTIMRLLQEQQVVVTALTGPEEWSRMWARTLFYVAALDTWQADYH
ncbi:MAG TPA: helix-turn-helix domain-containing protein, partial [Thermomicrobiales bacterium]|nr:helix-turn-helix domain-containing protein [Thermomicrobiales bacterium]